MVKEVADTRVVVLTRLYIRHEGGAWPLVQRVQRVQCAGLGEGAYAAPQINGTTVNRKI